MNFSFGRRQEKVEWRMLASVDVDRIQQEMEVKTLQNNIMHVTFCNIEAEVGMQSFGCDPNFIKMFKLAQLIIEYLLHSQQFLSANLDAENRTLREAMEVAQKSKDELEERREAYKKLKKQCQKQKQWIAEYQLLIRAGASGQHKCPCCAKSFVSHEYVVSHVKRKHVEYASQMNGMLTSVAPFKSGNAVTVETKHGMTEQEKSNLEQELERIKERLQKTERELQEERKLTESQRNRLSAEHQGIDELRLMFEKWKEEEKAEQQQEMAEFKRNYQQDLMRMQSERDDYSQKFNDLQDQLRQRISMVGSIRDEDETDSPVKPNSRGMSQQFITQLEDRVSQMQAETQQNLQKEMQKLQQKFKSREEKTKMDHREEMGKFQEMLKQYEENLNNERIEKTRLSEDYESKIQMLTSQVQDLSKALESQRVEREQVQHASKSQLPLLQDSLPPPVPAPRQTSFMQAESVERERASSPEKSVASGDSITLFVSSNQTKSGQFRLWRQSAYGSNEWSNLFTFSAFVKPSGNFAFPLYVFAAGGSPYWRQYISASPSPPSVEYRLDYMFYCSQTSLPGTFQCFVLEAGSVPVIRSCVSKSKDLQGWKYKGLSFFARNSTISGDKTLTSVSASFESTLTEDKSQDSEESESDSGEETPPPSVPKVQIEEPTDGLESTESGEMDIKELTSGVSSSEWGTGTLEIGEFRPYPNNQLITSRFNHKLDELQACRQEIGQILDQKLAKQGLSVENARLSSKKMEAVMSALKMERQARCKKTKGYLEVRQDCAEELEQIVKKTYRSGAQSGQSSLSAPASTRPPSAGSKSRPGSSSPTPGSLPAGSASPERRPPSFHATAAAVRTTSALQQSRKSPVQRGNLGSTGSTTGEMTVSVTTVTDRSLSATSVTEKTLSESEEDVSVTEDDASQDEEGSNWDSEREDAEPSPRPTHKVAVHIPSQQNFDSDSDNEELAAVPTTPKAAPRGEKVRELADTLERNLNFGSAVKKPAGGVSLHFQGTGNGRSQPQQMSGQRSSKQDDDGIESDFSISSVDEHTPGRRAADRRQGSSGLQSLGTTQPSGRGSPRLEFKRPQPQTTRVEAFTADDFSDDMESLGDE
ncbi:uncharacterized protein [Acropora muricata]